MFDELTGRLTQVFRSLRDRGKLTEENVRDSLREVRRALLAADVHFEVVRDLVRKVEAEAIGQDVLRSISPGQQVVKVVHDALVDLLGGTAVEINRAPSPPTVILLAGLQGSGKTTLAAKLGRRAKSAGERVLLVAADLQRPAAVDQLEVLGRDCGIEVFVRRDTTDAVAVVKEGLRAAAAAYDTVIVDTAGRLTIDQAMMAELKAIKAAASPHEVLLVVDAMTGQDAVRTARTFDSELGVHGVVLTKLDGDARGGAALSIRAVTGKPIKLASVGERVDALEAFHPERMASRILGMGDVVSLVERAAAVVDAEEAERLEEKLRREGFTLDDFLIQFRQLKKLGPLEELLKLLPGMGSMSGFKVDEGQLKRIEGMICSMTPEERRKPQIINGSRRKRIAAGSGTSVQDLNRLLKQFAQMQEFMKRMRGMGMGGLGRLKGMGLG
jgi:signal recognition particle subunit SRP54